MPILVRCGQCRAAMYAPEDFAGKRVKCPKCKAGVVVPGVGGHVEAPAGPQLVVAPAKDSVARYQAARQKSKRPIPAWMFLGLAALPLVAVGGVTWWLLNNDKQPAPVAAAAAQPAAAADSDDLPDPLSGGRGDTAQQGQPTPADAAEGRFGDAPAELSEKVLLDAAANSLVVLTGTRPGETQAEAVGQGVLIDERGLVATSYHVVSRYEKLDAAFLNETTARVVGYAALARESDLAILQLDAVPPGLWPLPVASLEADEATVAIAGPVTGEDGDEVLDLEEVDVRRVSGIEQLPEDGRYLLHFLEADGEGQRWWTFDGRLTLLESASGGAALLDSQGRLVGLLTYFNPAEPGGYALDAGHIIKATESLLPTPDALGKHILNPDPAEISMDRWPPSVIAQAVVGKVTAEEIETAFAAAEKTAWSPKTAEEYGLLAEVGELVTGALLYQATDGQEARAAAESVMDKLTGASISRERQGPAINEHAAADLAELGPGGIFAIGEVVGPTVGTEEGERALLVRLVGQDRIVAVLTQPSDAIFRWLQPGEKCLLLGTKLGVMDYEDAAGQRAQAARVICRGVVKYGQ